MNLYEQAVEERNQLQNELQSIEKKLKLLPKENFFCSRTGNYYKWYKTLDGKQTYIPKKDRKTAEKYAVKRYLSDLQKEILQELKALEEYLKNHSSFKESQQILKDPEYQKLLAPYFQIKSQFHLNWANEKYEHYTEYPEQLIHNTSSGIKVRSKSEAFIDMALYTNQIPFRYECALKLGHKTYYPDFTILHPKTNEVFYWEHLGLIDDIKYRKRNYEKIQYYADYGIYQSINLITTFETKDHPFSLAQAEKIVKDYFL